jgi:hypothetical protein
VIQDAPDQERFDSGNAETSTPDTVAEQAGTEVNLNLPLNAAQEGQNRQQPRSGEGEGSTGDTSNETETGQSAVLAPKQGE